MTPKLLENPSGPGKWQNPMNDPASGKSPGPIPPVEPSADRLLLYVMLAVAIWGSILSLGASLYGMDIQAGKPVFAPSPIRGLIVLTFVCGFLGVWWMSWRARKKRTR